MREAREEDGRQSQYNIGSGFFILHCACTRFGSVVSFMCIDCNVIGGLRHSG